jgi:hypothetical protein
MALVWNYSRHNLHNRFLSHPSMAITFAATFNTGQPRHKGGRDACWRKILRNLAAIDWHLFTDHQCQK